CALPISGPAAAGDTTRTHLATAPIGVTRPHRFAFRGPMRSLFAALALLSLGVPAMAQSPSSVPNAAPWDQPFLPPAPDWDGASRALLRDASDPWVTAFEADAAHDFSPTYA